MELKQQVCSLELAKRLKELGVKQDSLIHWQFFRGCGENKDNWELRHYSDFRKSQADPEKELCAFTVAELGEMLPMEILHNKHNYFFETIRYSHNGMWEIVYRDENKSNLVLAMSVANTEADVRAKMLIYLLENHLLTLC